VQKESSSHGPLDFLQVEFAGRSVGSGQAGLEPLQKDEASHGPLGFLQVEFAGRRVGSGQAGLEPLQKDEASQGPLRSLQSEVRNFCAGHSWLAPEQNTSGAHGPVAARQTKDEG
jgi:hypothetical protein